MLWMASANGSSGICSAAPFENGSDRGETGDVGEGMRGSLCDGGGGMDDARETRRKRRS